MSASADAAPRAPRYPEPAAVSGGTRGLSAAAMVGREEEMAALVDVVARPPAVAVVEGEAGIGKTRLVSELGARPELAGRRLVVGACRRVRDPFPLGPVVEAVRQLAGALAGVPLSPLAGALRPLLPELVDLLPPAPEPIADRRAERHRLFRALVEALAAAGPTVMVLEDLHWVDAHTGDFLSYLLADPPPQLSLVLTFRGEEVGPAVRVLPAKLPPQVARQRVVLVPLDPPRAGALAAAILDAGPVSDEFASYLCERASGLPFAIEELLALLRERGSVARRGGGWARRALDRLDVPTSIRDQVLERVSHLSTDARSVLAAAAALQTSVTLPVLTATCRLPQERVLAALDEACRAGMMVETDLRAGFRHVLAAQAVYEDVPPMGRQRLHARAAAALRGLDPPPLGQVAHHLRHAGDLSQWVDAAEQAADQAVTLGHDAEAARLLEEVLRYAALDRDAAGRIAVKLARAVEGAGGGDGVVDLLEAALDRGPAGPSRGELCLRIALVMDHSRHDVSRQRQLCLQAVDHLDPRRRDLRAFAMACLGIPVSADVPLAEHRDWLRRALAELAGTSDHKTLILLLGKAAMVQVLVGDPQWRELVRRIDAVAAAGGQPERREAAWAHYSIGVEACYAGHHDTARSLVARALKHTASWESPFRRASLQAADALTEYCRGAWDELQPRVERLIDQLADFTPARVDAEVVDGSLRLARGDLAGARQRLAALRDDTDHSGLSLDGLRATAAIRLALADGDPAAAAALARQQLAAVRARGWAPVSRCLPALTAALIAAGDLAGARDVVARAGAGLRSLDAPLAAPALASSAALLASEDRRWHEAADGLLAAAEEYDQRHSPYEAAQARERAAQCRFATGDRTAEEHVHAAVVAYQRLGAAWDLNRVTHLARRHGVTPPTRHRRGRRGYGRRLSPREREVAELMAAGRTNQEIAGELFLSVSTVEKHAMAVLHKLGARSRRQVGELMPPLDLDAPATGD